MMTVEEHLWVTFAAKHCCIFSFEQPGLVEGVPAHGKGAGTS